MGGSTTPAVTTQVSKTELPKWVENASLDNYRFAKEVANRPFEQYKGPEIAGLSDQEKAAGGYLRQGVADTDRYQDAAGSALRQAMNYDPRMVNTPDGFRAVNIPDGFQAVQGPDGVNAVQQANGVNNIDRFNDVRDVNSTRFSGQDLDRYMNPYTNKVVNTTMRGMQDNLELSSQRADDEARGRGAWGSSRSGVMQAVLQSQGAKDMAATEAGLRSSAYTDAAGRLMTDNDSALRAAMANQQSSLQTQGYNLDRSKANQASGLQTQALNAGIRQGNQQSALQTQQARLQAALANQSGRAQQAALGLQGQMANQDARSQQAALTLQGQLANQQAGLSGAQLRMQAGQGLNTLADSTANNAYKSALMSAQLGANSRGLEQARMDEAESRWQAKYDAPIDALNTRLAALGMSPYGKTSSTTEVKSGGESSNPLMTGLGAMSMFMPMLFSDRDTKTNIKKIGPTGAPGINAYEFEYKKSFLGKKGAKQVGVMADEVKRKIPGAVKKAKGPDGKTHDAVDYGKVAKHIGKKRGFLAKAA